MNAIVEFSVELKVASALNHCQPTAKLRVVTQVIRKTLHKIARSLGKGVHIHRVPTRVALVLCVMAAAIPALVAFTRDVDAATATADTQLAAVATPAVRTPAWSPEAAHSASMLIVGTLLIGAASAIRRAA
jgi:hypothetical protein